jgi:hypothetical protein
MMGFSSQFPIKTCHQAPRLEYLGMNITLLQALRSGDRTRAQRMLAEIEANIADATDEECPALLSAAYHGQPTFTLTKMQPQYYRCFDK